jgi:hypothetical protein
MLHILQVREVTLHAYYINDDASMLHASSVNAFSQMIYPMLKAE